MLWTSPLASVSTHFARYSPRASPRTTTPRAVSTLRARKKTRLEPAGVIVSDTGEWVVAIEPAGPGTAVWAEAMNVPNTFSSWIGAVDSIIGTRATVWPPLKSSVWAMSVAERPLALPLTPQIVPRPPAPGRPTAALSGGATGCEP